MHFRNLRAIRSTPKPLNGLGCGCGCSGSNDSGSDQTYMDVLSGGAHAGLGVLGPGGKGTVTTADNTARDIRTATSVLDAVRGLLGTAVRAAATGEDAEWAAFILDGAAAPANGISANTKRDLTMAFTLGRGLTTVTSLVGNLLDSKGWSGAGSAITAQVEAYLQNALRVIQAAPIRTTPVRGSGGGDSGGGMPPDRIFDSNEDVVVPPASSSSSGDSTGKLLIGGAVALAVAKMFFMK